MMLNNLKTDEYERCCTFDGKEWFSIPVNMKKEMSHFMK